MIATVKNGIPRGQLDNLIQWLENQGLKVHITVGDYYTVLGLVGNTEKIDLDLLASMDIIHEAHRISEPFKRCSRHFQPQDTVVEMGDVKIGGGNFCFIAGPCSVETHEQILEVAKAVKAAGANILRGGAFKPRTSPYDFQGLGKLGLEMLSEAKKETGLPICTEVMNVNQLELFEDVDIVQIGARNMQNFDLLKEVGKLDKVVLLKRGLAATMKEWLMSAEYIMSEGNERVILCERGIRTYETYTRNTLDLSCVPTLKGLSHLPVIVDPSHATGKSSLVKPMALAAAASGCDGLMIEVHNDPKNAWCDGAQSLTPDQFGDVAKRVHQVLEVVR